MKRQYLLLLLGVVAVLAITSACAVTVTPNTRSVIGTDVAVTVIKVGSAITVTNTVTGEQVPLLYGEKVVFFPADSSDGWDIREYMRLHEEPITATWIRRSTFDEKKVETKTWVQLIQSPSGTSDANDIYRHYVEHRRR